jgi:hypothetical protein
MQNMNYKIIEYNDKLELDSFYDLANSRGLVNNNSKKTLVDCFHNEREKQVWILYYNDLPIGSVAAHSFDDYKPGAYRILARTCVLSDQTPFRSVGTIEAFKKHQHVTARFFLPACVNWCGIDSDMYITTHPEPTGQMKSVHRLITKVWQKTGLITKEKDFEYRGSVQSVWKVDAHKFMAELEKYPAYYKSLK